MFSPPEMMMSFERSLISTYPSGWRTREVAGVKPAMLEGCFGRRRVLQIALHHRVAAQHQLAHRAAVRRNIDHRLRIDDALAVECQIGDPLARHAGRTLGDRQAGPFLCHAQTVEGP